MKYSTTFFALLIIIGFMLFILFANSINYNPIRYNFSYLKESFATLPQGWSFFTRNPREAQILVYKYENGEIKELEHKHSSPQNAFGLNRRISYMMTEVHAIQKQLPDEIFINARWNFQCRQYGNVPEEAYTVGHELKTHLLKGEYLFVYQEIIPWAWSKNRHKIDMPAKVARLNIL